MKTNRVFFLLHNELLLFLANVFEYARITLNFDASLVCGFLVCSIQARIEAVRQEKISKASRSSLSDVATHTAMEVSPCYTAHFIYALLRRAPLETRGRFYPCGSFVVSTIPFSCAAFTITSRWLPLKLDARDSRAKWRTRQSVLMPYALKKWPRLLA